MADAYCFECKEETIVVFDHSSGDTICSECGLVLESRLIDETSEWRTFANESADHDPVRVGAPTNPLLAHGGLSTIITTPKGVATDFLTRHNRISNPDSALTSAFGTIASMCDDLHLVDTIKHRANEIYKEVHDQRSCRGKTRDAILAACLFIACRQEDKPRTFKEIRTVANGAKTTAIRKAMTFIVKQLDGQAMEIGTVNAGDFVKRFCSKLGMTHRSFKAAEEAVEKSKNFDIRRSPLSIAAALIYIVTQLSDKKKSLEEVSRATGVAQADTIRSSCKDLHPHLVNIIPSWYAQEEDLKNLYSA